MKKQLQFELWQECNSLCKFCYLGTENRHTPENIKLNTLKNVLSTISDISIYEEYDTLAYLGGEFFQGQLSTPEIKTAFMRVMTQTADLLHNNIIDKVWIYATLTLGDQSELYEVLDLFKGTTKEVWILTSYDTLGRFHTEKMENNWKFHMKNIHEKYPFVLFNTTTILSEDCIDKYLNNELSFTHMMEEFHTSFFFKQCGVGNETAIEFNKRLPRFVPTRKKFIAFLKKFKLQEDAYMWDKLFNIQYRADMLYRNSNDLTHQMVANKRNKHSKQEVELDHACNETEVLPCGHLVAYSAYCDCAGCVLCDKQIIDDLLK